MTLAEAVGLLTRHDQLAARGDAASKRIMKTYRQCRETLGIAESMHNAIEKEKRFQRDYPQWYRRGYGDWVS